MDEPVGRRVEAGRGGDMARDVERILRAPVEAALDDPAAVGVGAERLRRDAGVPAQRGQRLAQRDEAPIHDTPVDAAGRHP